MPVATVQNSAPVSAKSQHLSFFRQSGWLMIATVAGGVFMWAVHLLSRFMGGQAYADFGVFLAVTICVPNTPIQMVFAQQTAKAAALNREHELSAMIRAGTSVIFLFWVLCSVMVLFFQNAILTSWNVPASDAAALYLTLPVVLFTACLPLFQGVLQGKQNFLWFGWSLMVQGVGRFAIAAVAVCLLRINAPGVMAGVLGGLGISLFVAVWATRELWLAKPVPFNWRGLLKQILPLIFGFGAYQFMLTADTMFMKHYLTPAQAAQYVGAGTLSRASTWLVGPLAAVMFPKIVHAKAKAEKSNLVGMVLIGTLILAAGGALGLSIVGPFAVKYMFPTIPGVGGLLPWYAWAVVPLSLANVLVNNLLARSLTKVVLPLCLLAPIYAFALTRFHSSPQAMIQTLGVFNTLLLAVCAWFTWGAKHQEDHPTEPAPTL